jgi:hypothetical protein
VRIDGDGDVFGDAAALLYPRTGAVCHPLELLPRRILSHSLPLLPSIDDDGDAFGDASALPHPQPGAIRLLLSTDDDADASDVPRNWTQEQPLLSDGGAFDGALELPSPAL